MGIAEVRLLGLRTSDFRELAADPAGFAAAAGFELRGHGALVQLIATSSAAFQEQNGIELPWGGYLALDPDSRALLGTCGFKGPPDAGGAVEIAYFTFPDGEGQGIGTAMARALCETAARQPGVRRLRAHTLPEVNASARILSRLGFRHTADVIDPEDGPVWRWERDPEAPSTR
jgi:RimJ/RimL family protein N-acetyltransferase